MKKLKTALMLLFIISVCLSLCSCKRVIRSPADELTMSSWSADMKNGNRLSLSFDADEAVFTAENPDFTLVISGYCLTDDEGFVICDEQTQLNYSFTYILHGDSIELSRDGSTVILDKDRV